MGYIRIEDFDESQFGLHPKGARQRMGRIAALIVHEWKREAAVLGKTRQAYTASIQIERVTEHEAVVSLPGPGAKGRSALLARIVEFGMGPGGIGTSGPYDVRRFLLRTQNPGTSPIRHGVNGPYRVVHFDRTVTEVGQTASGKQALASLVNVKGERVYSSDLSKQRTSWGAAVPRSMGAKLKPHHVSTDVGGGVLFGAESGASGRVEGTRFTTFRTASFANTNPLAWRSKGVQARHLAAKVRQRLSPLILRVV